MRRIQRCWAHLRPDFPAMIHRRPPGRKTAAALLGQRGRSGIVECTRSGDATCRQKRRDVWNYMTAGQEATHDGRPTPSLLPTPLAGRVFA